MDSIGCGCGSGRVFSGVMPILSRDLSSSFSLAAFLEDLCLVASTGRGGSRRAALDVLPSAGAGSLATRLLRFVSSTG